MRASPERLVDEIVGAEVERLDLVGFAMTGRQHDDRHVGNSRTERMTFLPLASGRPRSTTTISAVSDAM